jgi:hypothetical protein
MREFVHEAHGYQALRCFQLAITYLETPRAWKSQITWLWGPTGVGKTRRALFSSPGAYVKAPDMGKWYEGYDAHSTVIFDDLRPGNIAFAEMLRLFDRTPHRVETKGASRQWKPRFIFVTTCLPPTEFCAVGECYEQLNRRIEEVVHMTTPWLPPADGALSGAGAVGQG